jgi:Ca2+-binding RTX toxin-like protein
MAIITGNGDLIGTPEDDTITGGPGPDRLAGLEGNDTLNGLGGNDGLSGGSGNDTLNGGAGNDGISGYTGNDTLNGGDGNDYLLGGSDWVFHDDGNSGNDILNGGAGNDRLDGSDGDDVINGGPGLDRSLITMSDANGAANFSLADDPTLQTIFGAKTLISIEGLDITATSFGDRITLGAAADLIAGYLGNDRIDAAGGNDRIDGGEGDDVLYGGGGHDIIFGGGDSPFNENPEGNDRLYGGSGSDWLVGYKGNDLLVGGSGMDWLAGGDGSDRLTGGDGADLFIFSSSALGTTRTGEHDVVTDFVKGVDKLDLGALYESHPIGSISAGSAAHGEAVSNYGLVYNQAGTKTFVYGDADGVAGADFVIELTGSITLTAANLITTSEQWNAATGVNYLAVKQEGYVHDDQPLPLGWYFDLGFDA